MPNKTFKLTYPTIDILPNNLAKSFILGCYEGDGSISGKYISLTGTEKLLQGIENRILQDLPTIKFSWYCRHPERNNNIRTLGLSSKQNIVSFLNWLYTDATIYMQRKFDKYQELRRLWCIQ